MPLYGADKPIADHCAIGKNGKKLVANRTNLVADKLTADHCAVGEHGKKLVADQTNSVVSKMKKDIFCSNNKPQNTSLHSIPEEKQNENIYVDIAPDTLVMLTSHQPKKCPLDHYHLLVDEGLTDTALINEGDLLFIEKSLGVSFKRFSSNIRYGTAANALPSDYSVNIALYLFNQLYTVRFQVAKGKFPILLGQTTKEKLGINSLNDRKCLQMGELCYPYCKYSKVPTIPITFDRESRSIIAAIPPVNIQDLPAVKTILPQGIAWETTGNLDVYWNSIITSEEEKLHDETTSNIIQSVRGKDPITKEDLVRFQSIFHRRDLAETVKAIGLSPELVNFAKTLVDKDVLAQVGRNAPIQPSTSDKEVNPEMMKHTNYIWTIDTMFANKTERSAILRNISTGRTTGICLDTDTNQGLSIRKLIINAIKMFLGVPKYLRTDGGSELTTATSRWLSLLGVKVDDKIPGNPRRVASNDISHRELRNIMVSVKNNATKTGVELTRQEILDLSCLLYDNRPRLRKTFGDGPKYASNLLCHNAHNEICGHILGLISSPNISCGLTKLLNFRDKIFAKHVSDHIIRKILSINGNRMTEIIDGSSLVQHQKILAFIAGKWIVGSFQGLAPGNNKLAVIYYAGVPRNVHLYRLRLCNQQLDENTIVEMLDCSQDDSLLSEDTDYVQDNSQYIPEPVHEDVVSNQQINTSNGSELASSSSSSSSTAPTTTPVLSKSTKPAPSNRNHRRKYHTRSMAKKARNEQKMNTKQLFLTEINSSSEDIISFNRFGKPYANKSLLQQLRQETNQPRKWFLSDEGELTNQCPWPEFSSIQQDTDFSSTQENNEEKSCFVTQGLNFIYGQKIKEFLDNTPETLIIGKHKLLHRDKLVQLVNNYFNQQIVELNIVNNSHLSKIATSVSVARFKGQHWLRENCAKEQYFMDSTSDPVLHKIEDNNLELIPKNAYIFSCDVESPRDFDFQDSLKGVKSSAIEVSEAQFTKLKLINIFLPALEKEIGDLLKYETISNLDSENTNSKPEHVVSARVVYTIKINHTDGSIQKGKARIVARGFEDQRQKLQKSSYTISERGLSTILHHAVQNQHYPHSGDVTCAFLQGEPYGDTTTPLFLLTPECMRNLQSNNCNKKYTRILKSIYGLKDAPSRWQKALYEHLRKCGLEVCSEDPSLFRITLKILEKFEKTNHLILSELEKFPEKAVFPTCEEENIEETIKNSVEEDLTSDGTNIHLKDTSPVSLLCGVHVDDVISSGSKRSTVMLNSCLAKFNTKVEPIEGVQRFLGRDIAVVKAVHADVLSQTNSLINIDPEFLQKCDVDNDEEFIVVTSMDSYLSKIQPLLLTDLSKYQDEVAKCKFLAKGNGKKFSFLKRNTNNPFRAKIGELGWACKQAPYIAHDTSMLAHHNIQSENWDTSSPEVKELVCQLNELINLATSTTSNIVYRKLYDIQFNNPEDTNISSMPPVHMILADAGIKQGTTANIGYVECMAGGDKHDDGIYTILTTSRELDKSEKIEFCGPGSTKTKYNFLVYKRSTLKRIVRSSTGAEILAVKAAACSALSTRKVLIFSGLVRSQDKSLIVTDSYNLTLGGLGRPPAEQLLLKDYQLLRRIMEGNVIAIEHVPGITNLADILTKQLKLTNRFLSTPFFVEGVLNQNTRSILRRLQKPVDLRRYEAN